MSYVVDTDPPELTVRYANTDFRYRFFYELFDFVEEVNVHLDGEQDFAEIEKIAQRLDGRAERV